MIHASRICHLNDRAPHGRGGYVLYWMQASQRTVHNDALEYAAQRSNELEVPLVVCFGLMDDYPEANERHFAFMLEGLREVATSLRERGVKFVVTRGQPPDVALHYAKRAALVVCDRGYLRHQRQWRDQVADEAPCAVVQVESDVVVPVDALSDHQEFAARTIRPKIHRLWDVYLKPLTPIAIKHPASRVRIRGDIDPTNADAVLAKLKIDRNVRRSGRFVGGYGAAKKRLDAFVRTKLTGYATGRNEPSAGRTSLLGPYLHFGQISPVEIALAARHSSAPSQDVKAFVEELIVRRELAINFCQFAGNYDQYECLPAWAQKTLAKHRRDNRSYRYTLQQLEQAQTHDRYWNAAQSEMVVTGFMHNYMRMYWGKQILAWSQTPQAAFAATIYLNNKYLLCGRDPNAYANVGWIFGLHDRPWGPERPVFGTVRYMNAAGLERKFDMDAYVRKVEALEASEVQ